MKHKVRAAVLSQMTVLAPYILYVRKYLLLPCPTNKNIYLQFSKCTELHQLPLKNSSFIVVLERANVFWALDIISPRHLAQAIESPPYEGGFHYEVNKPGRQIMKTATELPNGYWRARRIYIPSSANPGGHSRHSGVIRSAPGVLWSA